MVFPILVLSWFLVRILKENARIFLSSGGGYIMKYKVLFVEKFFVFSKNEK